MKNKKLFLTAVLVLSLILTACNANRQENEDTPVTLTLMGKESDIAKSYMQSIFSQYETATGNKLDIISFEDSEFETAAAAEFDAGNAPDIFMHFNNEDLNRFDAENNFYYLNNEKWVSDLTDGARDYCTNAGGKLLGLPFWENSVSGCYYNKTILDSLGLKPAENQAEFDMLCQALADADYTPICWPADGCSWMPQLGLDPVFADSPETLEKINKNEIGYADIPEVTNMVRWLNDAAEKGWFGEDFLQTGWSDISDKMSSGEAVMTFIWDTWFYTDFAEDGKYSVDDFALMPVFLNTAENGTYEGGNLNMMMANKNSGHLDKVLEFLSFCADSKNYNIAFDGISTVNCFKAQTTNIQSGMVTDAADSISKNERVSTAASRVTGYSAEDMVSALNSLFNKEISVNECVRLMDEYRVTQAQKQGMEGF